MSEEKPFGYEGCTLTVETSDIDNKVTFAPLAKDEKRIDVNVQDVTPDPGLVYALAVQQRDDITSLCLVRTSRAETILRHRLRSSCQIFWLTNRQA